MSSIAAHTSGDHERAVLPGQETLLACWSSLATLSPGATVVRSASTAVAVFPSWAPLNNAIVLSAADGAAAADAASRLAGIYTRAGVDGWALWLRSRALDLDAPDEVHGVDGMRRDTTTLVMHAALPDGLRLHDGVVRTSIASAVSLGSDDGPASVADLAEPGTVPGLDGWVIIHRDQPVAGAWSFLHDGDCGIYGVETLPEWRRRGFARALVEHLLAAARLRGARSATLQSTRMGQPLYESLGFVAAGRYEEWVPA